jgi:hypothetical protein
LTINAGAQFGVSSGKDCPEIPDPIGMYVPIRQLLYVLDAAATLYDSLLSAQHPCFKLGNINKEPPAAHRRATPSHLTNHP